MPCIVDTKTKHDPCSQVICGLIWVKDIIAVIEVRYTFLYKVSKVMV